MKSSNPITNHLLSGWQMKTRLDVSGSVSKKGIFFLRMDYSKNIAQALHRLTERRLAPQWLDLAPRFAYPLLLLFVLVNTVLFLVIFIIPKFEKIFMEFKLKLPVVTETLIAASPREASRGKPRLYRWIYS